MRQIKKDWIASAAEVGLDPLEGLLWGITFVAMVDTLAWVFIFGLHWLWPVGFFIALIIETGVMGNEMENSGKEDET